MSNPRYYRNTSPAPYAPSMSISEELELEKMNNDMERELAVADLERELAEADKEPYWITALSFTMRMMKLAFRFGFIPLILYLGYTKGPERGFPEFTPLALVGLDFLSPIGEVDENLMGVD